MKKLLLLSVLVGLLLAPINLHAESGQWNFSGIGAAMHKSADAHAEPVVSTGYYTTGTISGTILIINAGWSGEIINEDIEVNSFNFGPMYAVPLGKFLPMAGIGVIQVDDKGDDLEPVRYFDFSVGCTYFPNGYEKSTFGFSGAVRYVHGLEKVVAMAGLTVLVR